MKNLKHLQLSDFQTTFIYRGIKILVQNNTINLLEKDLYLNQSVKRKSHLVKNQNHLKHNESDLRSQKKSFNDESIAKILQIEAAV